MELWRGEEREGGEEEEERRRGNSGDELHIVLRHQTNPPLQDSLQPAGL